MGSTFLEHGLVVNITKGNIIRMLPPLIINKNQVHDIIDILDKIIELYVEHDKSKQDRYGWRLCYW